MTATTRWLVVVTLVAGLLASGARPAVAGEDLAARETALGNLLVEKLGGDARTIRVIITGRKATLTGQVTERWTMELAEEVALSFPGVKTVDDQIVAERDVKLGPNKIESEAKDAALEAEVKGKLVGAIGKYARKVEVEASDGVVSLRGSVPDLTRRDLALRTVAAIRRVTRVIDLMTVPGG